MNKTEYIKVQCISTKSGFHEHLKIGEWYDVTESNGFYKIKDNSIVGLSYYSYVYNTSYDKCLFRTKDERRDIRLKNLI